MPNLARPGFVPSRFESVVSFLSPCVSGLLLGLCFSLYGSSPLVWIALIPLATTFSRRGLVFHAFASSSARFSGKLVHAAG